MKKKLIAIALIAACAVCSLGGSVGSNNIDRTYINAKEMQISQISEEYVVKSTKLKPSLRKVDNDTANIKEPSKNTKDINGNQTITDAKNINNNEINKTLDNNYTEKEIFNDNKTADVNDKESILNTSDNSNDLINNKNFENNKNDKTKIDALKDSSDLNNNNNVNINTDLNNNTDLQELNDMTDLKNTEDLVEGVEKVKLSKDIINFDKSQDINNGNISSENIFSKKSPITTKETKYPYTNGVAQILEDVQLVSVLGEGIYVTSPDTAEISFGIQTRAKTISEGYDEINAVYAKIIEALKNFENITEKSLMINYSSAYPVHDSPICEYEFNCNFSIKTKNLQQIESIIKSASDAGVNSYHNVRYMLENKTEAYNQALKAAKDNAVNKVLSLYANATLKEFQEMSIYSYSDSNPEGNICVEARIKASFVVESNKNETTVESNKTETNIDAMVPKDGVNANINYSNTNSTKA